MSDRKTIDQVIQKLNQVGKGGPNTSSHQILDTHDYLAIASVIRDLQKEVETLKKKLRAAGVDLAAPTQEAAQPAGVAFDPKPLRDELKQLVAGAVKDVESLQKATSEVGVSFVSLKEANQKALAELQKQMQADHNKLIEEFIKKIPSDYVTLKSLHEAKESIKSELRTELRPSRKGPRPPLDKQNVPEQIRSPQPTPVQEVQPPASETNKKKSWWKIFS